MTETTKQRIQHFLVNPKTLFCVWMLLAVISAITKGSLDRCNNFLIFKGVFWHTFNQTSLYEAYPAEYFDVNHYGPLFSLIIAPFAVVPHFVGITMWQVLMTLLLFFSIRKLPIGEKSQIFILWFCAHELLTALFMQQFNIVIAAIILLSFYFIEKEKDAYSAFFIVVGTLVKLYGIVGIAFFFFSKHKLKFLLSLIGWSVVLFALPMLISSPEYIIQQYQEWITCLSGKNSDNSISFFQNISLLGIVRKAIYSISGGYFEDLTWKGGVLPTYSDLLLIVPGCIAMAVGYFQKGKWKDDMFRQNILAGVLMFVCLFSTGTESSSYIIALIGCCIWYCCVPWKRNGWDIALMVFAFFVTSMSPSDLFPPFVRKEIIQPYALKALPVALIWMKLVYELITKQYCSQKA